MRRTVLSAGAVLLLATAAIGQERFNRQLPTDETAGRYGLVRQWYSFAPVDGVREKIETVSVVGTQVHLLTNASRIHVLDGERGKLLWTAQMGRPIPGQFGSAINSSSVFVINGATLYRLNREDGSQLWAQRLPQAANAAPAADEKRVMVSTADGRIYVYDQDTHRVNWFYQTNAPVSMPATLLDEKIVCASQDGTCYVFQASNRNPTLRFTTDAPVSAPLGAWGRVVLIPSQDYHVYAVDVRTGAINWRYSAGAPIYRALTVIENDVFVAPDELGLHLVSAETGQRRWLQPRGADFVASSTNRVYATDKFGQLLILDRANGRLVAQWDTHDFDFRVRNEVNDRVYLVASNGLVVCLREKANKEPVVHKKVEAPPPGDERRKAAEKANP
jgi:outer membrane protein assembly factor BamB